VQRRVKRTYYLPVKERIAYTFDKKFIVLGSRAMLCLSGQGNLPLEDKFARLGKNIFDLSVHSSDDMKIKIQSGVSLHDCFFSGVHFFSNCCIPFVDNRDDPKLAVSFTLKEHTFDFGNQRQFDASTCLDAENRATGESA
jgi:hypothetical protein